MMKNPVSRGKRAKIMIYDDFGGEIFRHFIQESQQYEEAIENIRKITNTTKTIPTKEIIEKAKEMALSHDITMVEALYKILEELKNN